ncbi:MAG: hypothetical protein MR821_01575, partial [Clostridiales bacterium]|nr:hypothetical protein [Clostridiales bacterium]
SVLEDVKGLEYMTERVEGDIPAGLGPGATTGYDGLTGGRRLAPDRQGMAKGRLPQRFCGPES